MPASPPAPSTDNPVLHTLLTVVRPHPDGTRLPDGLDSEAFFDIAHRHCLSALVNARLGDQVEVLSPSIVRKFRRAQTDNSAFILFIELGLDEIVALFRQHHIPLVAYKGIPLARTLYGDASLRPTGDIDVMVRQDDLPRVRELLEANGWEFERAWEIHHNFGKSIGGVRVILEVHWVSQREGEYYLSPDRFWDEAHETADGWDFSPEMKLLIIILHSARHTFMPYRQMVDIAHAVALWGDTLDWDHFVELALEADAPYIVATVLALASRDLGVPLPNQPMLQRLVRSRRVTMAVRYLSPQRLLEKPVFAALDRYIVPVLTGSWEPARLILHDLLPPPELIQYRYGIPKNSPLVPLYVIRRPFELLIKNIRKQFKRTTPNS